MNGSCKSFSRLVLFPIFMALASADLGAAAFADTDAGPTRAARLTYMQGSVTVVTGGSDKLGAQLNMPLLAGVQITTAGDGQAEVEFEDGSVVRLTPNTSLKLDTLAVQNGNFDTGMTLGRGLVFAELRAARTYRYAIRVGCAVLSPKQNLTVRIDFDQPPAAFSVLDGAAHVSGCSEKAEGFQTDVFAGESVKPDAADPNRYFLSQTVVQDSWDQWNQDMDQKEAAQSTNSTDVRNNYAGSQGYGWSDLDANGTWYDVQGTGPVWQPSIAADDMGFDPFGYGSWVGYPGFGYVWASGYPWGWTPYRCGNWSFFGGFGWGWSPAGCGGFGFVIGSRHPVNIIKAPPSYLALRPPQPGHGPERPLVPVHTFTPQHRGGSTQYVQRQIDGKMATAIQPQVSVFGGGRVVGGSALRRDFPVNPPTRIPVMGNQSTRPTIEYGSGPSRNVPATVVQPGSTREYTGQSHPERVEGVERAPLHGTGAGVQPVRPGYVQPPNAVQPRMSPPVSGPTQVHPAYTPPPQPRMSPPPAMAQPRMSMPAAAPPRMSAPAPPPAAPRSAPSAPAQGGAGRR